ncbi:hypothetical protein NHX12_031735 [Muraenolepis orangiensis]|uniref:Uncharacterized protein n=1 Tax=Muraenolepis orangiensis TaxID=630683 RepID=A0A9Q0IJY9_9TELE|nr:hypothetical protein NHX12_031735 [Muraenolepis orangiensis]
MLRGVPALHAQARKASRRPMDGAMSPRYSRVAAESSEAIRECRNGRHGTHGTATAPRCHPVRPRRQTEARRLRLPSDHISGGPRHRQIVPVLPLVQRMICNELE